MPASPDADFPIRRRLAAAGPPVQPEANSTDFTGTYPEKSAIPNRAL